MDKKNRKDKLSKLSYKRKGKGTQEDSILPIQTAVPQNKKNTGPCQTNSMTETKQKF
jgi:hypothetical protein